MATQTLESHFLICKIEMIAGYRYRVDVGIVWCDTCKVNSAFWTLLVIITPAGL